MAKRKVVAPSEDNSTHVSPEDCEHIWKRDHGIKAKCVTCGTIKSIGSIPKDAAWYDESAKPPVEDSGVDLDDLFPADNDLDTEDGDAK